MKHICSLSYPVLLSMILLAGCISEDLSDCPPTVTRLSFAHTTPCTTAPVYPTDIDSLHLYVFNADDVLTGEHTCPRIRIDADYYCEIPLPPGKHKIITWAGTGKVSQTTPTNFIVGKTTHTEALLNMRKGYCQSTGATDSVLVCDGSLYFGSDRVEAGSTQLVELAKNTTCIRVSVSGLPTQAAWQLAITGEDKCFKFDNTFTSSGKLNYIRPLACDSEGNAQTAVHILNPGSGSHPGITIRNSHTGQEIFQADLVKLITDRILDANFACTHEFDIDMTFKTDLSVSISVNGWNLSEEEDFLN